MEHSKQKPQAGYKDKVKYSDFLLKILARAAFERIEGHNRVYYRAIETLKDMMLPNMRLQAQAYENTLKSKGYVGADLTHLLAKEIVRMMDEAGYLKKETVIEHGDDTEDLESSDEDYDVDLGDTK